jgi:hypothetical protein
MGMVTLPGPDTIHVDVGTGEDIAVNEGAGVSVNLRSGVTEATEIWTSGRGVVVRVGGGNTVGRVTDPVQADNKNKTPINTFIFRMDAFNVLQGMV